MLSRLAPDLEINELDSLPCGGVLYMPFVEVHTVRDGLVPRIDVFPKDTTALVDFFDAN